MARIDYYLSVISPFCYFTGTRVAEIAKQNGADLVFKPVDIMSLFQRTGGTALGDRHPSRQAYRFQELARTSKKTGLPYHAKPMFFPTNPAPASYAIIAAQDAFAKTGEGDLQALVFFLLRACWAEQKDIAEDAVVGDALEAAGFDRGLTFTGMLSGAETYVRNLEEAVEAGVFGAPFWVCDDGEMFWGVDRLNDLDAHLKGDL
ncbi:2-hydroxychromene-2-carboxylate isomerase [Sagittula sp. NFXS13]|uniref:2-hydroxychromene-2-carboxylate isomerase n=1 Tax=Sagittula sp. NFXS13 TaxID=2819095 RepID=UPI0032DFFA54